MAEYIEREKVIDELEHLHEDAKLSYLGVYDCIESVPTADVVEVVRCKDCTYCSEHYNICHYGVGRDVKPDHYCGYGERRCEE